LSSFIPVKEGRIMAPHLLFYPLLWVALVLLCCLMHVWWPDDPRVTPQTPRQPDTPRRKRSAADLIVRVIAWLAEGLGLRGAARVFEIAPNTVLQWFVEAAEPLQAFSAYSFHDVPLTQVQLDALYAVRRAVRDGSVSAAEAMAVWRVHAPGVWRPKHDFATIRCPITRL
jgi:hypothetical protein